MSHPLTILCCRTSYTTSFLASYLRSPLISTTFQRTSEFWPRSPNQRRFSSISTSGLVSVFRALTSSLVFFIHARRSPTRFRAATSAGSGPQHRPHRPLRFPELCTRSLTDYHTFGSLLGTLIYQGPPRFSNRRRACCEPHSIYCKYMRGGQRTVTPG